MKTLVLCIFVLAVPTGAFCYDSVREIERQQQKRLQADMMEAQARALARQAEAMEEANRLQKQEIEDAKRKETADRIDSSR